MLSENFGTADNVSIKIVRGTNRYYNEDGKVAVLYSPGHGAGWSTWHNIPDLVFDPVVVKYVLARTLENKDEINKAIEKYAYDTYAKKVEGQEELYICTLGVDTLQIKWVDPGTEFIIQEYDGYEEVHTKNETRWHQA